MHFFPETMDTGNGSAADPPFLPPVYGGEGGGSDPGVASSRDRFVPSGLTIAISRETGARGGTIGKRVSKRLGWTYYDQELLQYLAAGSRQLEEILAGLGPQATPWIESQLDRLREEGRIGKDQREIAMARAVLTVGAKGKAIIVGRGAGVLLPVEHVLHVRIVAPLADRIGWIRQLHRLSKDQAADFVQRQDRQRSKILDTYLRSSSRDPSLYDLVLNSSRLGEQGCAHIIADAALQKQEQAGASGGPPPGMSVEMLG